MSVLAAPEPGSQPLVLVPFYPGDGTLIKLPVAYFAEFLRDGRGWCAFCHADPCAEDSAPDSLIAQFFARNTWARTCPCCDGRPT